MYVATSSSLLVLHKDFLMAEFKFMQVKTTFDDKLELINMGYSFYLRVLFLFWGILFSSVWKIYLRVLFRSL